jgi:AraC-like DNA-binding protein
MKVLPGGGYCISDKVAVPGEGQTDFVFARGWLLEIVDLDDGEYYFLSDGHEVRPATSRFAAFYPPFSLVRAYCRNITGRIEGVGAVEPYPELPNSPIIFETDRRAEFHRIEEAFEVLANAQNVRSIEVNTRPSLLTLRAKRLIDENYSVYPSIAKIANRLGVSHEHLSRQFKRDLGSSPSSYLHQLRVSDATFRLSIGEEIIEISQDVGYNDLSRFYDQFRKNTRTSPAACRQILNGRSTSKNAKTDNAASR